MNTLKNDAPSKRDIFYFRQRQKNRVYSAVLEYFVSLVKDQQITKKEIAKKLGKDPAQITRWLNAPGNWTLDTVSDLLLAMGAEMDYKVTPLTDRNHKAKVFVFTDNNHQDDFCSATGSSIDNAIIVNQNV